MPKFFNESNPVVKQKLEISEMSVELEQLKQAIQLLAEEGDKEFQAVNSSVAVLENDVTELQSQIAQLAITQKKTQKLCVILLILVGVSIVSSVASIVF